jgi:hypothetical protein
MSDDLALRLACDHQPCRRAQDSQPIRRMLINRLRTWWQERVNRFGTQTYEGARAEMGDAPWLPAPKSTDAWFILDDQAAAAGARTERRRVLSKVLLFAVPAATVLMIVGVMAIPRRTAPLPIAAAAIEAPAPPVVAPPPAPEPAPEPAAVAAPAPVEAQAEAPPSPPATPVRKHTHAKVAHAAVRTHAHR